MKSRQVGYLLIALIAIGVAGLIARVVSAGSGELTLEGILPVTPDVIDRVTIESQESEATLVKVGGVWQVDREPAFQPRLNELWSSVREIDGAQLIARNPENHERMGVAEGQGTRVAFWLEDFKQEEFIVGKWKPDVRLCYLRRPGRDNVYGVPCPITNIFDPNPDAWRNPVVVNIPRDAIDSITFTYPNEEFVMRRGERGWVVDNGVSVQPADSFKSEGVLRNLEVLLASGFAKAKEAEGLEFAGRQAISVRVVTKQESNAPTTRLRFLPRDDTSYYVKTPVQATVFIVDQSVTDALLLRMQELMAGG